MIKVAIAITTYEAIADEAVARAVFDAYAAVSPRIVPNEVRVWSSKYPIATADDFAAHWVTRSPYTLGEKDGPAIGRGEHLVGAEWRRIGSLSGQGRVTVRPENDPQRDNAILLEHNYAAKIGWLELFERLVAIAKPSYAMLHLFSEKEKKRGDRFERFDGPFAGEAHFVSWKSSLGEWCKPDSRQHEQRRRYRFLPELSWANFLGSEFHGRYDATYLASHAKGVRHIEGGVLFCLTDSIADVENDVAAFEAARRGARAAFEPGFFRIAAPPH